MRTLSSLLAVRILVSFFSRTGLTSMSPPRAHSPTIMPSYTSAIGPVKSTPRASSEPSACAVALPPAQRIECAGQIAALRCQCLVSLSMKLKSLLSCPRCKICSSTSKLSPTLFGCRLALPTKQDGCSAAHSPLFPESPCAFRQPLRAHLLMSMQMSQT